MAPQSGCDLLLSKYLPLDASDSEDIGPEHKGELPMYYGWPSTQDYLLKYPAHYKLEMPLMEYLSEKLAKDSVKYA